MESSHLVLRTAAGSLSLAVGLVHGLLAVEHLADPADFGLFAVAAALQVGWGAATLARSRTGRWWAGSGIAIHVACCGAWGLSRLVGLPLGHHAGEVQPVGLLDSAVTATQLVVAAATLVMVTRRPVGRVAIPVAVAAMLLAPAALLLGLGDAGGGGH